MVGKDSLRWWIQSDGSGQRHVASDTRIVIHTVLGHCVHWIQVRKASDERHGRGTLVDVDDGVITVECVTSLSVTVIIGPKSYSVLLHPAQGWLSANDMGFFVSTKISGRANAFV